MNRTKQMCKKIERKKDLVCDISERVFESGDKFKKSQKKKRFANSYIAWHKESKKVQKRAKESMSMSSVESFLIQLKESYQTGVLKVSRTQKPLR